MAVASAYGVSVIQSDATEPLLKVTVSVQEAGARNQPALYRPNRGKDVDHITITIYKAIVHQ